VSDAIAEPLVLDVAELPEPAGECKLWTGDADEDPEPCGGTATHVFVYDGKIGGDETIPRNCLACADCAPVPDVGGETL